MTVPSTHAFALACGVAGAYVDVSDDVKGDPISRRWGRENEFDDVAPGEFSFVLDNAAGKYTPGNAASSLATPLVEGMGVTWQLGSRVVAGRVRSARPYFVGGFASDDSARVRVTVHDMLGVASRRRFGPTQAELIPPSVAPALWWPLDDPLGTGNARHLGTITGRYAYTTSDTAFSLGAGASLGGTGIPGVSAAQLYLAGEVSAPATAAGQFYSSFNGSGVADGIQCWITVDGSGDAYVTADVLITLTPITFGVEGAQRRAFVQNSTGVRSYGPTIEIGVPYLFETFIGIFGTTARVNGVDFATISSGTTLGSSAQQTITLTATTPAYFSHLMTCPDLDFSVLRTSTAATRLAAIDAFSDDITFDTLPDLSPSTYGPATFANQSALDAINDVIRTEQGHVSTANAGTLLSPDEKIVIRGRDRPQTVSQSFDVGTEISDAPEFVRSIETMVVSVAASGPMQTVTQTDATLIPYVGSASSNYRVLLEQGADLTAWAQDRLVRGKNVSVRIAQFTIDALGTPTDRWDDITGLVPGDRIRITGLPSTQLGFSELDAYLIGGSETHVIDEKRFTFYICPVIPPVGIYDTDRYMAGGALSLSSSITSGDTTMSVATSDSTVKLSTTETPYNLLIDDEIVTVTACTSATPQVATITRAASGTTAAAHSSSAQVELATETIYAF